MSTINIPADPLSLRVGCVGGGQLGRMMALEAPRLNLAMTFLDPSGPNSPAALVVGGQNVLEGKLNDEGKLRELANGCDVLTVEIEHVGVDTLAKLESEGVNVQPSSRVVGIIQDKLTQKVRKPRCKLIGRLTGKDMRFAMQVYASPLPRRGWFAFSHIYAQH